VISLKAKNQFKLTPYELEEAITKRTKVLILSFPNNPTGAVMSKDDLGKIVEIIKEKDIFIISDEIYAEFTYDSVHSSICSFKEMKEKALIISGFSKAYAMTGWRVGYACGHPDLIAAMLKIHQYSIMSAPTTAQYAAVEALTNSEKALKAMKSEYDIRRKLVLNAFNRLGLSCYEPRGAFYAFPCIQTTGLTSLEFCEKLLAQEKVAVVPGSAFGECGEGFVRICYAYSIESIIEALKRIERFINTNSFK
jgi:aminotransferase